MIHGRKGQPIGALLLGQMEERNHGGFAVLGWVFGQDFGYFLGIFGREFKVFYIGITLTMLKAERSESSKGESWAYLEYFATKDSTLSE